MSIPGIIIAPADESLAETIAKMDKIMQEWTMSAARGECAWVCADCCCTFPKGMPDACTHGHQNCSDIIKRDKERAIRLVTPNAIGNRPPRDGD